MQILGIALGDPKSAGTYSGVPYHLFSELERQQLLAATMNGNLRRPVDILSGALDIPGSLAARRPKPNKYWRFFPESIARMSKRLQSAERDLPEHDSVIQIGVGAIPEKSKTFLAHAEISIRTAATLEGYCETYGFAQHRDRYLEKAMAGEKHFLEQCDVIWTNSEWTADTFSWTGIPREKFIVQAPACNCDDPGKIARNWDSTHILFIGKDWHRKGGPLLVEAFTRLRSNVKHARLTIIGCSPQVDVPGVEVLGYLDKRNPEDNLKIEAALRSATIFCMPSHWESTGIVYMEAALYGLPLIMLSGQGRETIFPEGMALHLQDSDPITLAGAMKELSQSPDVLQSMSQFGAQHVRNNYTQRIVAERLTSAMSGLRNR